LNAAKEGLNASTGVIVIRTEVAVFASPALFCSVQGCCVRGFDCGYFLKYFIFKKILKEYVFIFNNYF